MIEWNEFTYSHSSDTLVKRVDGSECEVLHRTIHPSIQIWKIPEFQFRQNYHVLAIVYLFEGSLSTAKVLYSMSDEDIDTTTIFSIADRLAYECHINTLLYTSLYWRELLTKRATYISINMNMYEVHHALHIDCYEYAVTIRANSFEDAVVTTSANNALWAKRNLQPTSNGDRIVDVATGEHYQISTAEKAEVTGITA